MLNLAGLLGLITILAVAVAVSGLGYRQFGVVGGIVGAVVGIGVGFVAGAAVLAIVQRLINKL